MFLIKSTRAISWPEHRFELRKGDNELTSRKAVPAELWEKLDRFRALKILDFEGEPKASENDGVKLAELTQVQLYALSKPELAELTKAEGLSLPEDASKAALIGELEKRLAPGAIATAPKEGTAAGVTVEPGGGKPVAANRRGSGRAVTVE